MKPKIPEVFMLESEENMSLLTQRYFLKYGIGITPINNSSSLIEKLQVELPDCIILDMLFLTNEICDVVRKLKTNEETQHIPIIFLTSKGLSEDRIKGYSMGCNAYVSKPFDPKELYSIIKSLLNHHKFSASFMVENYLEIKEIRRILREKVLSSSYPQTKLALTKQEIEILKKIIKGKTVVQMQTELKTSRRNLEKYLTRLLDKAQVTNIKELKHLPLDNVLIYKRANDGNRTRE